MNRCGIEFNPASRPILDQDFMPLFLFNQAFLKTAKKPIAVAVESSNQQISVLDTWIHGTPEKADADRYYVDRLVKTLLWQKGGFRVYVCGDLPIYEYIAGAYSATGSRAFDFHFMARVYEHPFEVRYLDLTQKPAASGKSRPVGRHLDGCRIGFDAGGSDRKVSAVIDGVSVFSEEVIWHPKENADPAYHFNGIVDSFKAAAAHMPRVDAIGVSSAGIYIDNRTMIASLFLKVPDELFDQQVKNIYLRAAKTFGDIPIEICNDGDVSALAGAMSLDSGNVLGIAMGTSEAGGYVDRDGNITGWLNELAFVPIDASPAAMADEWSGDIGCGVKYFSQDGVIKLAAKVGIDLSQAPSPAEKLKIVQDLMSRNDQRAIDIYASIGCYLGYSLAYYNSLYEIDHVLLLGRVMSGRGGEIILDEARRILAAEFPAVRLIPALPDEQFRRIGQSVAAASLPEIIKSRLTI
ncbi:MAG: ROK family protein [Clostridiaceae bacterium]|nr:ROK family protein [Clostridiaceae bacterium]